MISAGITPHLPSSGVAHLPSSGVAHLPSSEVSPHLLAFGLISHRHIKVSYAGIAVNDVEDAVEIRSSIVAPPLLHMDSPLQVHEVDLLDHPVHMHEDALPSLDARDGHGDGLRAKLEQEQFASQASLDFPLMSQGCKHTVFHRSRTFAAASGDGPRLYDKVCSDDCRGYWGTIDSPRYLSSLN